MKKIVFFVRELNYGGIEKQVITLANSLISLYNITIVFEKVKEVNRIHDISKKIKVITLTDDKTRLPINFGYKKQMRKILSNDIDIVVSTDEIFNSYILNFSNKNTRKIYWCHFDVKNIKQINSFDKIVVPTNVLISHNSFKEDKVIVIPNALDKIPDEYASGKNRIITVAKLTKNKAIDELIDIFENVIKKNNSIELTIIGDGDEKSNLEKLVKQKGLESKISFLGYLEKEKIIKEFVKSSIFVMTSYKETFGLAVIEAMSVGLPCIAFSSTKVLDNIIKNDINGYLIENRNETEMISKILLLLENNELRDNLGNCAKESSAIFDIKIVKTEWLKIL